jgi:hypothetical protein
MADLRQAAQQALKVLEMLAQPTKTNSETPRYKAHKAAITALRTALAQQEQEQEQNMTQEDIIRMAREAGLAIAYSERDEEGWRELASFAALVAAAERAACADICDQHASIEGIAQRCAAEIRARNK